MRLTYAASILFFLCAALASVLVDWYRLGGGHWGAALFGLFFFWIFKLFLKL